MTVRPIRSHDLLDAARLLAPTEASPGRPRTARLRRAVSTAYYALFHELVTQATAELCGEDSAITTERMRAARWFAHTDLRTLAEAVTSATGRGAARAVAPVLGSPHSELGRLAEAFVVLQNERYRADCDHEYEINRSAALSFVARAQEAIDGARRLEQSGDASYRRFLRLMVGAVKIARARVP